MDVRALMASPLVSQYTVWVDYSTASLTHSLLWIPPYIQTACLEFWLPPSTMHSTPELSPSQTPTPSDSGSPLSPTLSTSALSSPAELLHILWGTSGSESHPDILSSEGKTCPYSPKFIYPALLDPQVTHPDRNHPTVCRFDIGNSRPTAALPPIDTPSLDSGPFTGAPHCGGRDLPPTAPNRQLLRANYPSFVKFPETLPLSKPQLHGLRSPHPRYLPRVMGTEALISLAWTGEVPSPIVASGYVKSRIGDTFMWPRLKLSDPEMIGIRRASWPSVAGYQDDAARDRHCDTDGIRLPPNDPAPQPKRWTLSVAISDDQVTDETFVELLEELRLRRPSSTKRSIVRFLPDPTTPIYDDPDPFEEIDNVPFGGSFTSGDTSKAWLVARRMLLVCRELIRTERHYLLSLKALSQGETQSPVPPLMLSRLSSLVHASSFLLHEMEANPSVLGICIAFTRAYEQLEEAFMQWCNVAGQFFADPTDDSTPLVRRSNSAPAKPVSVKSEMDSITLKERVGSWGKKMHSRTPTFDDITSMVTRSYKQKLRLKFSVRDLAILPTQRITRYVLLFKNLQAHSPPPGVRVAVDRAAGAAVVLAQKANSAQDHPSFRTTPLIR